jgi:hypothetical protein
MSVPLDGKYALIRNAWIAALRREGHRQCREVWTRDGYQVCALALLAEAAGIKAADIPSRKHQIGPLAGLSSEQVDRIIQMNDEGDLGEDPYSFEEMADILEIWFESEARANAKG